MKGRGSIGVLVGLCLTLALLVTAAAVPAKPTKPKPSVQVQILGINDFHGQLQPSGSVGATPAGGSEFLATHIQLLEATNPNNTIVVSAGDLIGATPLISALFHDEPTIESMNLAGLDLNGVGNHEFDEGPEELLRMQNGGCHPVDGCQDGDGFAGAEFPFLAANVKWTETGKTVFPPYKIRTFGSQRIAFIGMTLEGTPSIVTPAAVSALDFLDEVETVDALVPQIQAKGVRAIVVLLHEGGSTTAPINESTINSCNGANGPAVDITNALHDEVDIVITGHTNWAVNCRFGDKIMTGARNIGRLVTDIDVTLDSTGEIDLTRTTVNNRIVTRTVPADPAQTALIAKYDALVAPLRDRVIGSITADITRTGNAAGESALGDVIADAQLDATDDPGFGDAVIAFMNAGGIRNDLIHSQSSGGEAAGQVTYGEAFNVQPFGNSLVTMTLSGATIEQVLERQFKNGIGILQVSNGFTYTYDLTRPVNDRIDPATVKLNGVTLNPASSYRVTVNNFLADGGDNYVELREGTNRLGGDVDLDALEKYLTAHSPVAPGPQNRITKAG